MGRDYQEYVESAVNRRMDELDKLRGKYQEAKALTVGRDGAAIRKLFSLVTSYKAGEPPEKAVYILAQAAMLVAEDAKPFLVVDDYERREQSLTKMKEQLPTCKAGAE